MFPRCLADGRRATNLFPLHAAPRISFTHVQHTCIRVRWISLSVGWLRKLAVPERGEEEPARSCRRPRVCDRTAGRNRGGEAHTHTRFDTWIRLHALSRSTPNSPAILIVTRISDASDIRLDTPPFPGERTIRGRVSRNRHARRCLTADYKFRPFLRPLLSPPSVSP